MIAPLAKLLDWLIIQLVWWFRTKSLLKLQSPASSPRLEEALQFLKGPDFIPAESLPARLEFGPARSRRHFRFPTPRPGRFAENNLVYGRLYRCPGRWQALSGDPFPLNLLQQITGTPYFSNCSSVVTTVKSCS